MAFLKDLIVKIENVFSKEAEPELTAFQKQKIMHEFHMFYDTNKDGTLQWKDFEQATEHICKLNGWKEGSAKFTHMLDLFIQLWKNLQDQGDEDCDGVINEEEWLKLWTGIYTAKLAAEKAEAEAKVNKAKSAAVTEGKAGEEEEDAAKGDIPVNYVPEWFDRYVEYKFNLYDRMGDGMIDADEFEYTLCDGFNMPPKECRAAFTMFSQAGQKKVDFPYFKELALEYYLSDESGALGNFINGKLTYD